MIVWRLVRLLLVEWVVDMVLFFNMLMTIVGYYFDPTVPEEELWYCRHVLMYRWGRDPKPDWLPLGADVVPHPPASENEAPTENESLATCEARAV